MMTSRVNHNTNPHSPLKEVMEVEESDCQTCVAHGGRLLSFCKVATKRLPPQSCAHSAVGLQDHFFVESSHNSKWTSLHVNIFELKAVFLAMSSFQKHLVNKRVIVASDNATVVSYLNKLGGRTP